MQAVYFSPYTVGNTGSDFCDKFGDGTNPGRGVCGGPRREERLSTRKSAVRNPKSEHTAVGGKEGQDQSSCRKGKLACGGKALTEDPADDAGQPNEELDQRRRPFPNRQRDRLDIVFEKDACFGILSHQLSALIPARKEGSD